MVNAVPVIGRQASHFGQPVQIQLIIQMIVDVIGHAVNAFFVVVPAILVQVSHVQAQNKAEAFDISC